MSRNSKTVNISFPEISIFSQYSCCSTVFDRDLVVYLIIWGKQVELSGYLFGGIFRGRLIVLTFSFFKIKADLVSL